MIPYSSVGRASGFDETFSRSIPGLGCFWGSVIHDVGLALGSIIRLEKMVNNVELSCSEINLVCAGLLHIKDDMGKKNALKAGVEM